MLGTFLKGATAGQLLTISPALGGVDVWDGAEPLSFSATGEYTVTPLVDTTIEVKMWGAGGACGYRYTDGITSTFNQGPGGGGGYSFARIILRTGSSYIFRIGQGGIRTTTISDGATYLAGGIRSPFGGTQGAGYSGIFKASVTQANALLMAGGGGGGADTAWAQGGGAGGGVAGANVVESTGFNQGGEGGTQFAGGAPSAFNGATAGSALVGGLGQSAQAGEASLGGGGGGYFGGGGGNVGGGGGGSGRISTDPDVSDGQTTAGSGPTPANSSDPDRGGAGQGGVAGATSGADGKILLTYVS
jgi:hypothetical protein